MIYVDIVANAFRTDLNVFNYMANFCYSVYFSLIVLKLGFKLLVIIRPQINYDFIRKTVIVVFVIFILHLVVALTYSLIEKDRECFGKDFGM